MIGRFGSAPVAMRGGAQSDQLVELILIDLINSMGTAFNAETNTGIYAELYAYALGLSTQSAANQRFANNVQPGSSYQLLSRWENILGIIPNLDETIERRQEILSLYFKRFSLPPTLDNLQYFAEALLGNIFIGFDLYNSSQPGITFFPSGLSGGLTIPGGATLLNGPWKSNISFINVRVWQPRDKYGNSLMDTSIFSSKYKSFYKFFTDYLPAWSSFSYLQYNQIGTGSIYGYFGSTTLTGIGTNFTNIQGAVGLFSNIEIVDDFGNVKSLEVASIQSDTSLTLVTALGTPITGNTGWRYTLQAGFILDTVNNLDRETFAH